MKSHQPRRMFFCQHKINFAFAILQMFHSKSSFLVFWFQKEPLKGRCIFTQPAPICSKLTIETLDQTEICSKLTVKTTKQRHWRRSGVFIVNFEHISHLVLVFLLLTFNRKLSAVKELVQHICSSFLAVSCFSKKAPSKGPTYAC